LKRDEECSGQRSRDYTVELLFTDRPKMSFFSILAAKVNEKRKQQMRILQKRAKFIYAKPD